MNRENSSLALAMIVKDAADTISGAIKSAMNIVDQIVILDTGSIDLTPVICTRLGAEVHFYEWNGSFADARNRLLNFVRTDWVISLDADEILDQKTLTKFRFLLDDDRIGGLRTKIINLLEDGKSASEHFYPRIFRNSPQINYSGRIHEQISDSILALGYQIAPSGIIIYHYGYKSHDSGRISRNRDLIIQELNESPDDPWLIYHLAETEFADKNFNEAGKYFIRIYDSSELSTEQREISMIRLAQVCMKNDDINGIMKWTNFKSREFNREGLRLYVRGAGKLMAQNFDDAKRIYNSKEVNQSSLVNKEQLEKAKELIKSVSLF
jgi:glycosyltransferase involved in cell wall biosynthesis